MEFCELNMVKRPVCYTVETSNVLIGDFMC